MKIGAITKSSHFYQYYDWIEIPNEFAYDYFGFDLTSPIHFDIADMSDSVMEEYWKIQIMK